MLIMRELTGGLYFGERHTTTENGVRKAVDTLTYDRRVRSAESPIKGV